MKGIECFCPYSLLFLLLLSTALYRGKIYNVAERFKVHLEKDKNHICKIQKLRYIVIFEK